MQRCEPGFSYPNLDVSVVKDPDQGGKKDSEQNLKTFSEADFLESCKLLGIVLLTSEKVKK
jgi:hypothetical protein